MDNNDFWLRCMNARCVIVPVSTYSEYCADGNTGPEFFTGIKYTALCFDDQAVGPDYYIQIEERQAGIERLYSTPEEALAAREASRA